MVSHLPVAVAVINSGATSGTKSDTTIELFRDLRFPPSSLIADRANRIGADYVRRNCLVFYKFLFSSTVAVEIQGTSTTLDPPPNPEKKSVKFYCLITR